jgi:signal transduction histidine kinase
MGTPERLVYAIGEGRIIALLGALYLALSGTLSTVLLATDAMLIEVVGRFALVGVLGSVLVYGGYRLTDSALHPAVYPRVVAWTFGGFGAMLAVLGTIALISPSGVDNPAFSSLLATALGSVGGFGAGVHDGRARTRERELRETVERLRTSNERLEQFAYAASHDLQEPLRMVSSYLQLLEARYADELDESAEEYIDFAVGGADRMRAMIESLLEYSRITSHGEPMKPTDAEEVLGDVIHDLQLRIEETDATITVKDLPTVTADPHQLAQVFRNLLSNALDYAGDEPPRVCVSAERVDDAWRFSVTDEGVGIDTEYHDRIFNVFEQLHSGEERPENEAGGIGLALCERIVERHGGEIWVESDSEEWTTFSFTIPVSSDRQSEPSPQRPLSRQ